MVVVPLLHSVESYEVDLPTVGDVGSCSGNYMYRPHVPHSVLRVI
jgi:hypothetical protein